MLLVRLVKLYAICLPADLDKYSHILGIVEDLGPEDAHLSKSQLLI